MSRVVTYAIGLLCLGSVIVSAMKNPAKNLKPKAKLKIHDGSKYSLEFQMKHDDNLPVGSPELCDPNNIQIAPDGLPYLAARYFPFALNKDIVRRTGFHTIGIDWNPCGHPDITKFGVPHYDIHFYMIEDSVRETLTCDLLLGAPVCNFLPDPDTAQSTDVGKKFFHFVPTGTGGNLINMPANYHPVLDAAVPQMGLHNHQPVESLPDAANWIHPVLIMGSYDSKVIFWEPMVPASFVSGDEDKEYFSGEITYINQTIIALPSSYTAEYNHKNGKTTFVIEGTAYPKCNGKNEILDKKSGTCAKLAEAPQCASYTCETGYTFDENEGLCLFNGL